MQRGLALSLKSATRCHRRKLPPVYRQPLKPRTASEVNTVLVYTVSVYR